MAGRIPKPKAERQRMNKTQGARLPRSGSGRDAPEWPGDPDICVYASDYWEMIWSSPMGLVYLDADIPALVRLTELVHMWSAGKEQGILGEIRNLEDRFGLSPLSRRRLEWEIVQAGGQPEDEATTGEGEDRWLRAVS